MPIPTSQTFKRLIKETENSPIEAMEEGQANYNLADKTHNQKIYETLALAAAIVAKLLESPKDRQLFDSHEFWDGARGATDDDSLPRRVLRFLIGAKSAKGNRYEQARAYAEVVSHLISEGLSPNEILERLKESSVHKMMLLISKRRQRADDGSTLRIGAGSPRSVVKAHVGTHDSITDDASTADIKAPAPADQNAELKEDDRRPIDHPDQVAEPSGSLKEAPERRPSFKSNRDVSFDAGHFFDDILGIAMGDEVTVILRREESDKSWIELRAIHASFLHSRPHLN